MNARARPAVHHDGNVAESLPGDGKQDVRIARIHVHFVDAGVLIVVLGVTDAIT